MVKKNKANLAEMLETNCYVCKVAPGELHEIGCTVERCPYCGHQLISCFCEEGSDVVPDADRMPWTGEWPGDAECREFGWFCQPYKHAFVPCGLDAPQAMPDLNRLHTEAVWDRKRKRFVLPTKPQSEKQPESADFQAQALAEHCQPNSSTLSVSAAGGGEGKADTGESSRSEAAPPPAKGQEVPAEPDRRHEAVLVREGDMEADIDVNIAPLVREIWKAGIETTMSCQEDYHGYVWLEFPTEKDLLAFLGVVVSRYEKGRDSVYNRSVGDFMPTDPNPRWEFEIHPLDYALHDEDEEEVWHEGTRDIAFDYSVRFPPADLPLLLRRLRKHNSGRKKAV